jgi:hypothetical protein
LHTKTTVEERAKEQTEREKGKIDFAYHTANLHAQCFVYQLNGARQSESVLKQKTI